jgi:hypothetical protein
MAMPLLHIIHIIRNKEFKSQGRDGDNKKSEEEIANLKQHLNVEKTKAEELEQENIELRESEGNVRRINDGPVMRISLDGKRENVDCILVDSMIYENILHITRSKAV